MVYSSIFVVTTEFQSRISTTAVRLVDILHWIADSFRFSPRNSMLFADGAAVILVVTRPTARRTKQGRVLQFWFYRRTSFKTQPYPCIQVFTSYLYLNIYLEIVQSQRHSENNYLAFTSANEADPWPSEAGDQISANCHDTKIGVGYDFTGGLRSASCLILYPC